MSSGDILAMLGLVVNVGIILLVHLRTRTNKQEDDNINRVSSSIDRMGRAIEELSREMRDHYLKGEAFEIWRREHKEDHERLAKEYADFRHDIRDEYQGMITRLTVLEHEASRT